jgi:virginiamycin B lyase
MGSNPIALISVVRLREEKENRASSARSWHRRWFTFRYNRVMRQGTGMPQARLGLCSIISLVLSACTSPDLSVGGQIPTPSVSISEDSLPAQSTSAPATTQPAGEPVFTIQEYDVPSGAHPHDVAPAVDGGVWYTAQRQGALGYLDPVNGETHHIPLGVGSAPHGVIVGPDGAPWITDTGLNAIVRVDPQTEEVRIYPMPSAGNVGVHTAVFADGILWFTGQAGFYGRLNPATGEVQVYEAPRGRGPYGITAAPSGDIYYASLAGNYVGRVDPDNGAVTELELPTPHQGARRVWADSLGRIWVSEWNVGQVALYDPGTNSWREWKLPGDNPFAYAVYVDEQDGVWLSDFGSNALVLFDPQSELFTVFELPSLNGEVRQVHGRAGEIWGAESRVDKLIVIRTASP